MLKIYHQSLTKSREAQRVLFISDESQQALLCQCNRRLVRYVLDSKGKKIGESETVIPRVVNLVSIRTGNQKNLAVFLENGLLRILKFEGGVWKSLLKFSDKSTTLKLCDYFSLKESIPCYAATSTNDGKYFVSSFSFLSFPFLAFFLNFY